MSLRIFLSAQCDVCRCFLVTNLATLSIDAPDITTLWSLGIQQGWRFEFLAPGHKRRLRCLCSDCFSS